MHFLKMKKCVYIICWEKNSAMKLGITVFLWVITFMLLHHKSSDFLPLSQNTQNNSDQFPELERCDILEGDWVRYEGGPLYNKSCSFITDSKNCVKNGRPESGFLQWRWKPRACYLPQFEPLEFLEMMRNKGLAFVGDSLSRNHFQSLMCMVSTVEQATLVYHKDDLKTQKWLFPSYNFTSSIIWSPYLAKTLIPKNAYDYDASPSEVVDINLDELDPNWTDHYKTWDYIVFSSDKWYSRSSFYYYENNTVIGCHHCQKTNFMELRLDSAYRRVMKSVFDYTIESNHSASVFYRTTSPIHFGHKTLRDVEIEEFGIAYARASSQDGVNLRLLDVNKMSLLRHGGFIRKLNKNVKKVTNDCLPGPIDSWNDVLMEMMY